VDLDVYVIALALHRDPPSARKLAKKLIKRNPNAVKLYNAYALVESRFGNYEVAGKVWQTTLNMISGTSDSELHDTWLLWSTWVAQTVLNGPRHQVLEILSAMGASSRSPLDTGRAPTLSNLEHQTQFNLTKAISSQAEEAVVSLTNILALIRYCQSEWAIDAAIQTYQNILAILIDTCTDNSSSPPSAVISQLAIEKIYQHQAQLIHHHASTPRAIYTPKQILKTISSSLSRFPNNSIFISLHAIYTHRHNPLDRLRSLTTSSLSNSNAPSSSTAETLKPLIRHLHTISQEISSLNSTSAIPASNASGSDAPSRATEHSIRASFRAAIAEDAYSHSRSSSSSISSSSSSGKHSPYLRTAFLAWEAHTLAIKSSKLNDLRAKGKEKEYRKTVAPAVDCLYAALRDCPYVKGIYMVAFRSAVMREAVGVEGLKDLYESMVERGLRVRVDLEGRI
jgi:tetratricopeptide (TPR) repeat protein